MSSSSSSPSKTASTLKSLKNPNNNSINSSSSSKNEVTKRKEEENDNDDIKITDFIHYIHSLFTNCRPFTEFVSPPSQWEFPPGFKMMLTQDRIGGLQKILTRLDLNVKYFEGNYAVVFLLAFLYFSYLDPVLRYHMFTFFALISGILFYNGPVIQIFNPLKNSSKPFFSVTKTRSILLLMFMTFFSIYQFCFSSFVRSGGLSSVIILIHAFFSKPSSKAIMTSKSTFSSTTPSTTTSS